MSGAEYFGETAQPRDHIYTWVLPVNTMRKSHNHTLSRQMIRLSTTTHNLLTFIISEISSNKTLWERIFGLRCTKRVWTAGCKKSSQRSWCERGAKFLVAKEISGRGRRRSDETGKRKLRSLGFSFHNLYFTTFFYFVISFFFFHLLYFIIFYILFLSTTFIHTHTHDSHPRPTTHDI